MSDAPPQRSKKRDLTAGSPGWNTFRLAAPAAVGILLHSVYALVDAFWLGKLGKVAITAPGLTGPLSFITVALGSGLAVGGTALVSQHTGAGQHRQADRAAAQTLLLLTGIVTAMGLPMMALAPHILRLCQAPEEAIGPTTVYLRLFMLGLPFTGFAMAYAAVLRALGDTVTVVLIGVVANLLNFVLDPVLIFGLFGLPRMGVAGAALATAFAQVVGGLACLGCLLRGRAGLRVRPADLRPDWPMVWRIVRIGTPAGVAAGSNSLGFATFQAMVNSFGTTVVGAFTIGFRVLHFFNAPMDAMAMAGAPIVGQALGAGKVALARRAIRTNAMLYASAMLLPALALMFGGKIVAAVFIKDPDVVAETGRFFLVVPFSTYFFGITMMLMAAFHGSGHTRPALVVSLLRMWVVRVPAAYLFAFVLNLGSIGVYLGMVAGNIASASVALWLFLGGTWETAVIHVNTGAAGVSAEEPRAAAPRVDLTAAPEP